MRVCIIAVLIIGLYIGAEAQRGGRGGNGGRVGGRPGGRVGGGRGKWNKGPRKGILLYCRIFGKMILQKQEVYVPQKKIYTLLCSTLFFFKFSGLGELCDTDLDELECEDGQWPRLFKGSACEDINDGDQFPNWKELENPCTDAVRLPIHKP